MIGEYAFISTHNPLHNNHSYSVCRVGTELYFIITNGTNVLYLKYAIIRKKFVIKHYTLKVFELHKIPKHTLQNITCKNS